MYRVTNGCIEQAVPACSLSGAGVFVGCNWNLML